MPKQFEIIWLNDLMKLQGESASPAPGIFRKSLGLKAELNFSSMRFGESPEGLTAERVADDKYDTGSLVLQSPETYLIRNCTVWSKYGVVFVDNYLIRETLFAFPRWLMPEIKFVGERYKETAAILSVDLRPDAQINRAYSTLAGIQVNYYHWLFFVMAKITPALIQSWPEDTGLHPALLLPSGLNAFQNETLNAMLRSIDLACVKLDEKACIAVDALVIPVIQRNLGLLMHPIIKTPLREMARSLAPAPLPDERLYISRRDSANRRLENELALEAMVETHGYRVVSLTGKSVAEQIALFASATHVIGPHGAGLSNVVFCRPGTKILEIHASFYLNWCYRRLSVMYDLDYGCIFGHHAGTVGRGPHGHAYFLEPSVLERVLRSSAFSTAPRTDGAHATDMS